MLSKDKISAQCLGFGSSTTEGAYRGGFPGVSGNPFGFYTPTKIEAKGLQNIESVMEQDTF